MSGHLVYRTLKTNDAAVAVTHLIDMGVEPFLISSTLEAVLGQRLLRSICRQCRAAYQPNEALLEEAGISRRDLGEKQFFFGKRCAPRYNPRAQRRKRVYTLIKHT